jgi:Protein of unknown function (DUF3108)
MCEDHPAQGQPGFSPGCWESWGLRTLEVGPTVEVRGRPCYLLTARAKSAFPFGTSWGGKNYKLIVKVIGREKVRIQAGTFDGFHAKPFVKYGTVFRNKEDIDLWITANERHIPVLIKSAIVVGSVEISLLDAAVPDIKGDGGKWDARISP